MLMCGKLKFILPPFKYSNKLFSFLPRSSKDHFKLLSMSVKEENENTQSFELYAEQELRFSVADQAKVFIKLKHGTAECFGTELISERKYTFRSNTKASIFTWQGCKLELTGKTSHCSVVKETPMVIYVNIHAAIEQMRQNAEQQNKKGPTVLVVGPKDAGKSSLCRILINYAVRQGRKPVFIDLDVGQGQISIPGTVGALVHDSQIDLEDIFNQKDTLVYHFGKKSPGHNLILHDLLTSRIADMMNSRIETNQGLANGIIINTCGWVQGDGYRSITYAALTFEVDVILVIGHDRLYRQLQKDMPKFVKIVFIPKTIEVFERSTTERIEARERSVRDYFYGSNGQLSPHKFTIPFSEIQIYRIDNAESRDSYFPPGTKYYENKLCLVPVEFGFTLLNHILSVSFASSLDDDVIGTNVAGFICILGIDIEDKTLTVLSPHPPPLPEKILLFSEIIFTP